MKLLKPEAADDPLRARALDLLARREHSERELYRKLCSRGYADEVVSDVIHALLSEGLLSDVRFTESFIRSRVERGSGPRKIVMELRERGIDGALIETCLNAYRTHWARTISLVREKKFGAVLPQDFRERSRQMRFLQQRGFTPEQIAGVFRDRD
jgi:regulatory protein